MKKVSFVLFLIVIVALFATIILNYKENIGKKVLVATIVQTIPYIGFPNALNTLKIIQDIK